MAKGADKASLRPALETIRHKTVDPVVGAARSVKHAVGDAKGELSHKGGWPVLAVLAVLVVARGLLLNMCSCWCPSAACR